MKSFSVLMVSIFIAQLSFAQLSSVKVNKQSGYKTKSTSTKSTQTKSTGTTSKSAGTTTSSKTGTTTSTTTGRKTSNMGGSSGSTGTSTTTSKPSTTTTTNSSGNVVTDVINVVTGAATGTSSGGGFTETEAANAIKDALLKGITNGVDIVSKKDGYFGNQIIKILLPKEAQAVESTLRMIGAGSLVDNLVVQLNRSAEQSAKEATPIFLNSIKQLTISDAVNIVSNQQPDAATQFLKRTTTNQLAAAFKPKVGAVLDKTGTTTLWKEVFQMYNKVPFVQPINPDLNDYVTHKALDGLFYMVGQEEAKIRKDPAARTTDILSKVFGSVFKK